MSEFGREGHFVLVRRRNLRNPRQQWHVQWRSMSAGPSWQHDQDDRHAMFGCLLIIVIVAFWLGFAIGWWGR